MKDLRKDKSNVVAELLSSKSGIMSGIQALDDVILGFRPGELITIGARPSMGKSSLMRTIALNMSKDNTVCFFSLEDIDLLKPYLLCNLARVNADRALSGMLKEEDIRKLKDSESSLRKRRILYDENTSLVPEIMKSAIEECQKTEEISCVFIDYIQLISLTSQYSKREEEIGFISRQLKEMATDLKVPIIAATQLNRKCEERENKRPRLSDIRESGTIEQDCNKVLLLYRQSYYDMRISKFAEDSGEAEIIVAKNRGGKTGTVKCGFLAETMQFCDDPDYISEKEVGNDF
jgi:replicative DNA helicase